MIQINETLSLRRPTYDDVQALIDIKNTKESALLLGGITKSFTEGSMKEWIDFHNNRDDEALFLICDNDKPIGHIGLYKINRQLRNAEIGILIGSPTLHGKGYGTQSTKVLTEFGFNKLGLHRITALVLEENMASYKMFEKCGYKREGLLIDKTLKNGRYYNVVVLSIINDRNDVLDSNR